MCTLLGLSLRAESIFFPAVYQSSGRSHVRWRFAMPIAITQVVSPAL